MVQKCSKCIQLFQERKNQLQLISDLKAKNEGMSHVVLKSQVCDMIRKIGQETSPDQPVKIETEACANGIGKVDVVGQIGEVTIAVECGNTNGKKIAALREKFDIVLHVPYCYTQELFNIDMDELKHQLAITAVFKELEKRNLTKNMVRNKPICLEEGVCSLPSGRKGYPEEAMRLAGLP